MHRVPRRPWRTLAAVALTTLALPAVAHAAPASQPQIDGAIQRGAAWIPTQVNDDGFVSGTWDNWSAASLAAAGVHPADVRSAPGNPSLQDQIFGTYTPDWLASGGFGGVPPSPGALAVQAVIASSAGIAPTTIAPSFNLAAELASHWNAGRGDFGNAGPLSDGYALLAADVLHLPRGVTGKVKDYLRRTQKTVDGGWTYTADPNDGPGDSETTGIVLSMLCQAGARVGDPAVDRGLNFLRSQFDGTIGGFPGVPPYVPDNTTSAAAMVVIGLKACGIDPQGPDWTTLGGENPVTFLLGQQRVDGSFRYVPGADAPDPGTDANSTQAAIRALSNYRWSAPAPARANPADPRMRPAPTVADGTVVPIALGVDDGVGDVRFCAVQVPSGTPLTEVLQTASTTSVPSGCVRGLQVNGTSVATLNGATAIEGRGWLVQVNGARPQLAGDQRIGFGDVVSLDYGAYTTERVEVPGPGTVVTVIREVIKTVPAKAAKTKKKTKPRATCRVRRGKKAAKDQVRCSVKHAPGTSKRSTARLTRKGRLYAKGKRSLLRQHGRRQLVKGHHYTLRLGKGKRITKIRVTLR